MHLKDSYFNNNNNNAVIFIIIITSFEPRGKTFTNIIITLKFSLKKTKEQSHQQDVLNKL